MVLLLVPLLILLIVGLVSCFRRLRVARLAVELRGDWWPRFEREFRAYASRSWQAAREAERRT